MGIAGAFMWLLRIWGFWPSLAVAKPVAAAAAISGVALGWLLNKRRLA